MRQRHRRQARIDFDGEIRIGVHSHGSSLQRVLDKGDGRIHDLFGVDPVAIDGDSCGINAGHVEDVLEQARQAIELGDRRVGLHDTFRCRHLPTQILDRHLDRGQWCSQIVTQRGEQRGREIRLLFDELGGVSFLKELGSLDRNRHHTGDGIKRADVDQRRDRGQQADGLGAMA